MEFNKRVVVAGAGKSGIGAARLLLKLGAEVIIFDQNDKTDKVEVLHKLSEYEKVGVVVGKLDEALLDTIDLMVIRTVCRRVSVPEYSGMERDRAGISCSKRKACRNHRYEWKDHNNSTGRRNLSGI